MVVLISCCSAVVLVTGTGTAVTDLIILYSISISLYLCISDIKLEDLSLSGNDRPPGPVSQSGCGVTRRHKDLCFKQTTLYYSHA